MACVPFVVAVASMPGLRALRQLSYGRTKASMRWAIMGSSVMGMTKTDRRLPGVEMRSPSETFARLSSFTPSHASLLRSAAR